MTKRVAAVPKTVNLYVLAVVHACLIASACTQGGNKDEDKQPPASLTVSTSTEAAPLNFEQAAKRDDVVRLSPNAFGDLPAPVKGELKRRGCTIPQVYFPQNPSNVVKGHFTTPSQIDIAALCSVEGVSSILVFRNGSPSDVSELASAPDLNFLQEVGDGKIGYSRGLGVADSGYIQQHFEALGGPKPPPVNHEGINDIFVEKASRVWYWYDGNWLELTGAD